MKDISVNMYYVKAALQHATRRGANGQYLLKKSGIPAILLANDNARIGVGQYAALQKNTILALDDIFSGYTATPVSTASFVADCHWMLQSRSVLQVLRKFCRRYNRHTTGCQTRLQISGDSVQLLLDTRACAAASRTYLCEHIFFNLHRWCCWLTGQQLPLNSLTLDYASPAHAAEYRQMFPQCPLTFAAAACCISYPRRALNAAIIRSDTDLRHFLRNPILEFLTNRHIDNTWSSKTRAILRQDLSHIPNLIAVAAHLQVSAKVLRQHLLREGVTYREIKQQLRRDLAIYYLSQQQFSIEDIALKTGYSEASAFIRSFKQWTGVTPYLYQKGQRRSGRATANR